MRFSEAVFGLLAAAGLAQAEVKVPALFASHMVLQREHPIHVWGWADANEAVSVQFASESVAATADVTGRWSVYLKPANAGGPYKLTVRGSNTLEFDDVLVGDVWFASGQSNMEMPLSGWPGAPIKDSQAEIQAADHPDIRLFLVERAISQFPLEDFGGSWSRCTPETAPKFSAVAYFFGREIARTQHVPVGLIDSTWGGTPAESWTSIDTLSSDASLMPAFATWAPMVDTWAETQRLTPIEKAQDEAAKAAGRPVPHHAGHPPALLYAPSALYNAMVAPAVPFRIRGVIWYQGEANGGHDRAPLYNKLFPALIEDWRMHWQEGDFPFLFVQLANFHADETWAVVREAQRRTLKLRHTGMAVTADIGDPSNIHPADKQDVGARLALAARALSYGEMLEYSGP